MPSTLRRVLGAGSNPAPTTKFKHTKKYNMENHTANISAGHVEKGKVKIIDGCEVLCIRNCGFAPYKKGVWYPVRYNDYESKHQVHHPNHKTYWNIEGSRHTSTHFDLDNPRYPEAQQTDNDAKRLFTLLEEVYKELYQLKIYTPFFATESEKNDAWETYCRNNNLNHLK